MFPTRRRRPSTAPKRCTRRVLLPGLRPRRRPGELGPRAVDAPVRGRATRGLDHRRRGAGRQPPATVTPGSWPPGRWRRTRTDAGSANCGRGAAAWAATSRRGCCFGESAPGDGRPGAGAARRVMLMRCSLPGGGRRNWTSFSRRRPGRSHGGSRWSPARSSSGQAAGGGIRLAVIGDPASGSLGRAFVAAAIAVGSTVVSDGWPGLQEAEGRQARARTVVGRDASATWCLPGCTGCSRTRSGGPWRRPRARPKTPGLPRRTSVFRFNSDAKQSPPPPSPSPRARPHPRARHLPAAYQMLVGRSCKG